MMILHENLGEGFDPEEETPAKPAEPDSHENKRLSTSNAASASAPMMSLAPATEIYTKINVSFNLDTLEAVLYNGDSQLDTTVKVSVYDCRYI